MPAAPGVQPTVPVCASGYDCDARSVFDSFFPGKKRSAGERTDLFGAYRPTSLLNAAVSKQLEASRETFVTSEQESSSLARAKKTHCSAGSKRAALFSHREGPRRKLAQRFPIRRNPAMLRGLRRFLILLHRYLGIPLSFLFVVWFASGIAMIYVGGMPSLTPAERLEHLAELDLAAVRITPAEAAKRALDESPAEITLAHGARPARLPNRRRDGVRGRRRRRSSRSSATPRGKSQRASATSPRAPCDSCAP